MPSAQIYKAFHQHEITEKIKNDLGMKIYTPTRN